MKPTSTETTVKKILIVDDHPLVRQGIVALVSQQPNWDVVGEADTAHKALQCMEQQEPDMAIVDLTLKDRDRKSVV